MGETVKLLNERWQFVLNALKRGDQGWEFVAEQVEETMNVVAVVENINASLSESLGERLQNCVSVEGIEASQTPLHISHVVDEALESLKSLPQFIAWNGKPFKVMPFIESEPVNVTTAINRFTHWSSEHWAGEVYLHYAPLIGRVLVSVDARHFIGCIAKTRTMDALALISAGGGVTVRTRAFIVTNRANESYIMIGTP